jgi:hypothetical protein
MEEEKELNIMIAIPSMGEVSMMFTVSLVGMILKTKEKYPNCSIRIATVIRRLIHRSRAELAEKFLETDCNLLMWIDDDNPPQPDDLNKLIEKNLPIVSGLYFKRNAPYEPIIMVERANGVGTERRPDLYRNGSKEPFRVNSTGMGFMLVKREVIEAMKALGIPLFDVRGNVGEDIWFCLQARQAGYDIMIAPDVEIAHLGERLIITGEKYMEYYKEHIQEVVKEALSIDGWQSYEELHYLAEQASNSNFTIEVGSYKGRSAKVLANSKRLICVDIWGNEETFEEFAKILSKHKNVQHLQGNYAELADNFPNECADLIVLENATAELIEKYMVKLKISGKMIFHAFNYHVDEYINSHKYEITAQRVNDTELYELVKL